eukprot:2841546-Pleurochrysis_carterae.AAC.1
MPAERRWELCDVSVRCAEVGVRAIDDDDQPAFGKQAGGVDALIRSVSMRGLRARTSWRLRSHKHASLRCPTH